MPTTPVEEAARLRVQSTDDRRVWAVAVVEVLNQDHMKARNKYSRYHSAASLFGRSTTWILTHERLSFATDKAMDLYRTQGISLALLEQLSYADAVKQDEIVDRFVATSNYEVFAEYLREQRPSAKVAARRPQADVRQPAQARGATKGVRIGDVLNKVSNTLSPLFDHTPGELSGFFKEIPQEKVRIVAEARDLAAMLERFAKMLERGDKYGS